MVRTIKKHPSLFSIVLVLAAMPLLFKNSWLTVVSATAVTEPPAGFPAVVMQAGLGPVELAAAGVSAAQTTGAIQDVLAEWNSDPSALPDAQSSYVAAKQERQRLERLVRSGRASAEEVSALATAKTAYEAADSAREAVLDALFLAGTADLTTAQADCLETLRDNADQLVPTEYCVVDRTEAEWLALETALANERISADYDETPAAECVSHLATVRAEADVAAAKTACESNLSAVKAAWNAATGG